MEDRTNTYEMAWRTCWMGSSVSRPTHYFWKVQFAFYNLSIVTSFHVEVGIIVLKYYKFLLALMNFILARYCCKPLLISMKSLRKENSIVDSNTVYGRTFHLSPTLFVVHLMCKRVRVPCFCLTIEYNSDGDGMKCSCFY